MLELRKELEYGPVANFQTLLHLSILLLQTFERFSTDCCLCLRCAAFAEYPDRFLNSCNSCKVIQPMSAKVSGDLPNRCNRCGLCDFSRAWHQFYIFPRLGLVKGDWFVADGLCAFSLLYI